MSILVLLLWSRAFSEKVIFFLHRQNCVVSVSLSSLYIRSSRPLRANDSITVSSSLSSSITKIPYFHHNQFAVSWLFKVNALIGSTALVVLMAGELHPMGYLLVSYVSHPRVLVTSKTTNPLISSCIAS